MSLEGARRLTRRRIGALRCFSSIAEALRLRFPHRPAVGAVSIMIFFSGIHMNLGPKRGRLAGKQKL